FVLHTLNYYLAFPTPKRSPMILLVAASLPIARTPACAKLVRFSIECERDAASGTIDARLDRLRNASNVPLKPIPRIVLGIVRRSGGRTSNEPPCRAGDRHTYDRHYADPQYSLMPLSRSLLY